ncbi:MAG: hypothetical protein WD229_00255 [Pirellulales bacterium]
MVRARRRLAYLMVQREQARAGGNREREEVLAAELRWLAPAR